MFILLIKEAFRERLQPVLSDQFHKHILGGTDQIKAIAERKLVVQIFIGAECRVFNLHIHAICLTIPLLKVFDHGVFPQNGRTLPVIQVYGFLFIPVSLVNIFFPVGNAQSHLLAAFRRRYRSRTSGKNSSGQRQRKSCGQNQSRCRSFERPAALSLTLCRHMRPPPVSSLFSPKPHS